MFSYRLIKLKSLCEKLTGQLLNIRLVLGQDVLAPVGGNPPRLQLQQEAANLAQILQQCGKEKLTPQAVIIAQLPAK